MLRLQLLSMMDQQGNFRYALEGQQHFYKVAVSVQTTGEAKF